MIPNWSTTASTVPNIWDPAERETLNCLNCNIFDAQNITEYEGKKEKPCYTL